jgi:hypothetical protein
VPSYRLAAVAAVAATSLVAGCGGAPHHRAASKPASPSPVVTTTPREPPPPRPRPRPRPVYPLTGLPVTNKWLAARPALSVKIDNVEGSFPQAGLNRADIVADVLVEGGLTRLFATFQSQNATMIGPVRSARPVDADLLRLYGPSIFAYSGAATGEIAPTIQHGDALRLDWVDYPQAYVIEPNYARPHDVFTSTLALYALAHRLDPRLPAPRQVFSYSTAVPSGRGVWSARWATIPFSPGVEAGWRWTGRGYVRYQNGVVDMLVGNQPVTATNVVVLGVQVRSTNIVDAAGNHDPLDVIVGHGAAVVLRNGRVVVGSWIRRRVGDDLALVDHLGRLIPLAPGRTWLELMPDYEHLSVG